MPIRLCDFIICTYIGSITRTTSTGRATFQATRRDSAREPKIFVTSVYTPRTQEDRATRTNSVLDQAWDTRGSSICNQSALTPLESASLTHFACHGSQDLINPLDSALHLSDGDLKVSKIMEQHMPTASLAFLSACETAKGDEKTPDEAIHLASTMLFTGFRGVVGTMWYVSMN